MAKAKKATKKFVKSRLKTTLQERARRKQKTNRWSAGKRSSSDAGVGRTTAAGGNNADKACAARGPRKVQETYKDMDVDSFLAGGFEAAAESGAGDSDEDEVPDEQEVRGPFGGSGAGEEEEEESGADEPPLSEGGSGAAEESFCSDEGSVLDDDGEDLDEHNDEDDVVRHKRQLEDLKQVDPDFYKYLQENDQELLDFDLDGESEDSGEEEEGGSDAEGGADRAGGARESKTERKEKAAKETHEITNEVLDRWQKNVVERDSMKSLKRMLLAFGCAAQAKHIEDEKGQAKKRPVYEINDSSVFNNVIVTAMKCIPAAFDRHCPIKKPSDPNKRPPAPSSHPRWKKIQPAVRSFLGNMLHILRQVTDATMLSFIMKSAEGAMPYFGCFSKMGRILVKTLLSLWSTAEDKVRIGAFFSLIHLAKSCPNYVSLILKGSYMTLVQACRETNSHTLPTIQLLMNCMVELYGVDLQASYQHAFVYIRQMAIHLRSAMTTITKDSFKAVYNWQYLHCLRLWARVIGAYTQCGKGPLDPLLYPLVQVSLGVVRLIPTAKYFPLRFHVVRSLIGLIKATNVFIPLGPTLLEVLDTTEMRRSPKPSTLKPLNFELHIRAPNEYLHTRTYHVGVAEQVTELFLEYEAAYADSLAYPELMTPAVALLKKHAKLAGKNRKFAGQLQHIIGKVNETSRLVVARRAKLENASPASLLTASSSWTS